jgi:hypothetical protein
MEKDKNPFVQSQLLRLFEIERELICLYAESCYADIQAAHGNRTCMDRGAQLDDALRDTECRLSEVKARLKRIGVPRPDMFSLDALQRLALFEATFRRHDAAFASPGTSFDRQQLCAMLEEFAEFDGDAD